MTTRKAAAEALGVSINTLGDYRNADWFPQDAVTVNSRNIAIDWDVEKIRAARSQRDEKTGQTVQKGLTESRIELIQEQIREKKLTNEIKEIEADFQRGNILRLDEWQQHVSETMAALRESLSNLPFRLARIFKEEAIQQFVKTFTEFEVNTSLMELVDKLDEGTALAVQKEAEIHVKRAIAEAQQALAEGPE